MFNITLKYFRIFNNKQPESLVADIIRDFLTCYSCSYYSSMERLVITSNASIFSHMGNINYSCLPNKSAGTN